MPDPTRSPFVPLVTPRLVVRAYTPADADALTALRNDPDVARYQSWSTPFPHERVVAMIDDFVDLGTVTAGEWYHLAVEHRTTGEFVGDLPVNLHSEFPVAEVGYSFAPAWQGQGLATEAMTAFVDWLFGTLHLRRLEAYLHPDNVASARLLERLGFLYEGTKRLAFGTDDDPSDDPVYGLLRADWGQWQARPRTPATEVSLVEVTPANLAAVTAVTLHRSQERDLPRAADALLAAVVAGRWHQAVVADGEVVGVVVAAEADTEAGHGTGGPLVIIDRLHQARGLADQVRSLLP